ncbi:MAG: GtrA family protein [Patescibacteria group bacterium]
MTKKDYKLVTLIGFLVGWLVLPVIANIGKRYGVTVSIPLGAASVLGFSAFAPLALWVLHLLSKKIPVFLQFGKFAAVGTLNTLLNFAVLNTLIFMTDISAGWTYTGFTVIAFFIATTNSYFWNKFWTFQSRIPLGWGEYARFALFTVGGVILNSGVASLIVNGIGAPQGVAPELWANVGALGGVAVSFLWNFLTYRRIVFRASGGSPEAANPVQ